MKLFLFISFYFVFMFSASSQEVRYQTLKAQLKISAVKNGGHYQWENKNITVMLNYKTGEFILRLKNTDFTNTSGETQTVATDETKETEYIFKGTFPINDIVKQENITRQYPVELQLTCDDPQIDQTLNFQMEVTRPGSGSGNYRIFTLQGIMYNDEVQIPAFKGFDNEINLLIMFNALASY